VVVLSNGGDQLPIILFVEVVGNAVSVAPAQIGGIALNVGTIVVAIFTIAVAVQPLVSV
jgi:hypothetical protein